MLFLEQMNGTHILKNTTWSLDNKKITFFSRIKCCCRAKLWSCEEVRKFISEIPNIDHRYSFTLNLKILCLSPQSIEPQKIYRVVADRLREEEVDGEALLSLTQVRLSNPKSDENTIKVLNITIQSREKSRSPLQNDLTAILEIKLGPAIKIFNAITAVRLRHS